MIPDNFTSHILTGLLSVATTLVLVMYLAPSNNSGLPTGIVTIDPSDAVMQFILSTGARDITDAEYEPLALQYQQHLEQAIEDYAQEHSVIVVNSAAVLTGAPDITDIVSTIAINRVDN